MEPQVGAGAVAAGAAAAGAGAEEAEPAVYEVNVKCIDGSTTRLEVPCDLRGTDLKELISERLKVPVDRQRLIFRGKVLKDEDIIGHHITESGQTLHMVQRPGPPPGPDPSQPPPAASRDGAAPPAGQGQAGPQVHFQLMTADGGGIPLGIPQVDLSQILSTVVGASGRGAGMGPAVHATPVGTHGGNGVGRGAGAAPQQGSAPAPSAQPGSNNVAGSVAGVPQMQPLPPWPTSGAPGSHVPMLDHPAANAALALQPLQIIFQQGLGMIPMLMGETAASGDAGAARNSGTGPAGGQGPSSPVAQGGSLAGEMPFRDVPWRDLRRLHQHLARVLGRPNQHRVLPPTNMPAGELHSFLSVLQSAIAQLNVAVGDLQASLLDGTAVQPRYRLQLAMALVASARTLRGAATVVQSGVLEGTVPPNTNNSRPSDTAQASQASRARAGATAVPGADSDTDEEPRADDIGSAEPHGRSEEEALELVERTQGEAVGSRPPASMHQEAATQAGDVAGDSPPASTSLPPTAESEQIMQMLPQLFEQLTQPSSSGGAEGEASGQFDGFPPEVVASWHQWTSPESFRQALAQSLQPPFNQAYVSGDATSSHHPMPPPEELLQLWSRSASDIPSTGDVPETPDSSREYLNAFLRDLSRYAADNSEYASLPDAQHRYPHLARIAALLSAHRAREESREAATRGDEVPLDPNGQPP